MPKSMNWNQLIYALIYPILTLNSEGCRLKHLNILQEDKRQEFRSKNTT